MDLRKRLASKPQEPEKMAEPDHAHDYREFRLQAVTPGLQAQEPLQWPVRECRGCKSHQVFGANGWIDDDWTQWPFPVKEQATK